MSGYDSICCFRSSSGKSKRLLWELTRSCNLKCDFCHRGSGRGGVWTLDTIVDAIAHIKRIGFSEVILSGGEPLLLKWLDQLVYQLKENGLSVDLCTNATLVTSKRAYQLAEVLSEISVSIDSATPQIHNELRGVDGAWASAIRGCRELVNVGLDVHIISLVSKTTIDGMFEVAHLSKELGAKSLAFIGQMPLSPKKNWLSDHKTQKLLREIVGKCRAEFSELTINTKRLLKPNVFPGCAAGKTIFGLDARGYLSPCILFSGHHLWADQLSHITNSYDFSLPPYDTGKCGNCDSINKCQMGCPGSYYLQMRSIGPDTLCEKLWSKEL